MKRGAITCLLTWVFFSTAVPVGAESPDEPNQGRVVPRPGHVLAQRQRVEPVNRMLTERLNDLLPELMRETGIDMWLVLNREYAEDPVFFTLVPDPVFAARRTTMLVFHDRGPEAGVDRLSVNRYPFGELYEPAWEGGDLDAQWTALGELVAARDPRRIGVDVSRNWPVADGLSAALRDRLLEVLPAALHERVVGAEELVVRWMETRSPGELAVYPQIVALARGVISEAFSSDVITPGVTTTEDVEWAIRQRFHDLQLDPWFHPHVDLQRRGMDCPPEEPFCGGPGVIAPGDVLHTDVGVCYLRLCTDTQEMAYVARLGEEEVPPGLVAALAVGNRWQDHLTSSFELGRTGNEILAATSARCEADDILASTYTHPLGFFGHAPGPVIGMWDNQGPTPVRGDWPLHASTVFSIEGNVKVAVPSWDGQLVQIALEQDAVFDGEAVTYLAGRQTRWHLVR
ncbi:MAG: M24 family metallopeptidase [Acidobacteriota bacterium]|nr:M24 family metallopeptidase [Acidobacteriota bacterium]